MKTKTPPVFRLIGPGTSMLRWSESLDMLRCPECGATVAFELKAGFQEIKLMHEPDCHFADVMMGAGGRRQ